MTDLIPLVKANKPTAKKSSGASKPKNTGSHTYMPAPGGMGKPPKEGDVTEFVHPKHGRKHRGRVTAVGQDGYRARVADGSAVDVPHTHHLATLPTGDFGTEQGLSPQDAKEAFLGPTREGGLPATDMQVAILDVMAQHGFPIDEESITKINYDDAQKIISKFILTDQAGERTRGPASSDMQPGGGESTDGTDAAPGPSSGPTGGDPGAPQSPEEEQGQSEAESMGPGDLEPPDEEGQEDDTPGNDTSPTPDIGQPPDEEDQPTDGTDAQDSRGPSGGAAPDSEEQGETNPEVLMAIQKLIEALENSSESAGKKNGKPIIGKKAPSVERKKKGV